MPYFNNPKTNETFEVPEEHARVLRSQGFYQETVAPVKKEAVVKEATTVSKKKTKKKSKKEGEAVA